MHTDGFWAEDYKDEMSPEMIKTINKILTGEDEATIESFINKVRHPVSSLRSSLRVHGNIPDAKDISRYITKLKNKIEITEKHLIDLSELLNDAPYELSQKASKAKAPTDRLSRDLIGLCMLLNDIELPKSKKRPEVTTAVQEIATEFESVFGFSPKIRAYREREGVKLAAPTAERFTPLLAALLNCSVDYAYRLAKTNLPS